MLFSMRISACHTTRFLIADVKEIQLHQNQIRKIVRNFFDSNCK